MAGMICTVLASQKRHISSFIETKLLFVKYGSTHLLKLRRSHVC